MNFGLRWEFTPFAELPKLNCNGVSFASLRLETFLRYGGPLADFLKNLSLPVNYFSDYLPVASSWDQVHRLAMHDWYGHTSGTRRSLSCRRAIPEVPRPDKIVRELMENLPNGIELSLLVRNRKDVNAIRDLNGVFFSIEVGDWLGDPNEVSHFADRVLEIEVPLEMIRSGHDTVKKIIGEVVQARARGSFNVVLVFPPTVDSLAYGLADDFVKHMREEFKLDA
jgi:hypothetical protein